MCGVIVTLNVREQRLYLGRRNGSMTHAALTPPSSKLGTLLVGRLGEDRRQVGGRRLFERLQREAFEQLLVVEDMIRKRRHAD